MAQNNEMLQDYYESLESQQIQIRKLRHDINNYLDSLLTFINSEGKGNAMPYYEKLKEMAEKYVKFMYDHNGDYMDLTLKIAGRTSVYEAAGKVAGNEHTTAVLETLSAPQSQARPMVTTWSQIEEVLIGVVESSLGGADVNATLEAAKAEIESIGR